MTNGGHIEIPRSQRIEKDDLSFRESERKQKPETLSLPPSEWLTADYFRTDPDLLADATIDLTERYPHIVDEILDSLPDKATQDKWREHKEQLLAAVNAGTRIGNELKLFMLGTKEFGPRFRKALEMPELADHAADHSRMLEATQKMLMIMNPDTGEFDTSIVMAAAMFPGLHDTMQLLRRYYNIAHPEAPQQDARILHEEEEAFLIKCLTGHIADCGQLQYNEAEKISTYLAIFVLVHDKHEELETILQGTNKAYTGEAESAVPISDTDVYPLYRHHELDLTTLSRHQWYVLYQGSRKEKQIVSPEKVPDNTDSEFGLIPFVEEGFRNEIQNAIDDRKSPQFVPSDEQRRQLLSYLYINVLSDVLDMGYPAEYALPRKLCGSKALSRPLVRWWTDLFEATDLDHPDQTHSAWSRAMIEFYMIIAFAKRTPFWQDAHFRERLGNTVLMQSVRTDTIFADLMEEYATPKPESFFSHTIHIITDKRVQFVIIKAMGKHKGIPSKEKERIIQRLKNDEDTDGVLIDVMDLLRKYPPKNKLHESYADRLWDAVARLHSIIEVASKNLALMPKPDYPEARSDTDEIYSSDDRMNREINFSRFFSTLFQYIEQRSDIERSILFNAFRNGAIEGIPILIPQGTTSLGDILDVKTIHDKYPYLKQILQVSDI